MKYPIRAAVASYDVAFLVHPCEPIKGSAGEINGGELSAPQQITVAHAAVIQIPADNVATSVDPSRVGIGRIRKINGGQIAITQQQPMNDVVGRAVYTSDVALRV